MYLIFSCRLESRSRYKSRNIFEMQDKSTIRILVIKDSFLISKHVFQLGEIIISSKQSRTDESQAETDTW